MLFRQFFDAATSSYTYLLASREGGRALVVDPLEDHVPQYQTILSQLDLTLAHAVDTHTHADHVTGLGKLRDKTGCSTVMSKYAEIDYATHIVREGDTLSVDDLELRVLLTPGHTEDSLSLVIDAPTLRAVFTGDALLIRGTGRTDLNGGNPHKSWDSIVNKLFALPDDTIIYPAHDYKGWTASSIGEEKRFNPRVSGKSEEEYLKIMNNLDLPVPRMHSVKTRNRVGSGQP